MCQWKPRRIGKARDKPINRARSRCSGGNVSARIAINTRLAMGIRGASVGTAAVLGKDDWEAPKGCSCKSCNNERA